MQLWHRFPALMLQTFTSPSPAASIQQARLALPMDIYKGAQNLRRPNGSARHSLTTFCASVRLLHRALAARWSSCHLLVHDACKTFIFCLRPYRSIAL